MTNLNKMISNMDQYHIYNSLEHYYLIHVDQVYLVLVYIDILKLNYSNIKMTTYKMIFNYHITLKYKEIIKVHSNYKYKILMLKSIYKRTVRM
jgi:hypothetical protein